MKSSDNDEVDPRIEVFNHKTLKNPRIGGKEIYPVSNCDKKQKTEHGGEKINNPKNNIS